MFDHDLIKAIRQYPCLYDKSSRCIHEYNKCWNNVASETGVELERCQARWRSLRDRYVKEHRYHIEYNRTTSWKLMKSMEFLKDFIGSRKSSVKTYKRSSPQEDSDILRRQSRESVDHNYCNYNINYYEEQEEGNSTSQKRLRDETVDYHYDDDNPLEEPAEDKGQIFEEIIESTINETDVSQLLKTETTTQTKINPTEAQTKFDTLIDTLNKYLKSRIRETPKSSHYHFYGLLSTYFAKLPENEQDKLKADILLMVLNKTRDI